MQLTEKPAIVDQNLLECIRAPVAKDLEALDTLILSELHSDVPLIREITEHIVKSGGKRLRPLLVILFARACGHTDGNAHLELAAIIEFVHTATLLHDDVIDNSALRRGRKTANAIWGNQASVLIGDFLYSRAFQMLTRRAHVAIMQALANTTNAIAEGEVLQLMNCRNATVSAAQYFAVIEQKTATLFASAAEIGAMLTADNATANSAAQYGLHLGFAFQIIDDLLDYAAVTTKTGKNIGDDLAEGKPTLPLIYTLQHCDAAMQTTIRNAIEQADTTALYDIVNAMQAVDAFAHCHAVAKSHLDQAASALAVLPASPYKTALLSLLPFVLNREF